MTKPKMNKVRWGLLSTAAINRRLIPAIRASARGELVAVASRSQAAAETYARQWQIPLAFGSYEAMLASDAVDAVYIGLPNHLHAEWSIKAMAAGKHVLCEKPFALSPVEVDAVAAASQQYGPVVMEAFMYRHHPQMQLLREWVESDRLGEVVYLASRFSFRLQGEANVRWRPEWGGGCLWDVGIYPVSLAQFVFGGPPVTVAAEQRLGETGIDVFFVGQMRYGRGGLAQIQSSFSTPFQQHALIVGTEGRMEMRQPFNPLAYRPDGMIFYDHQGGAEIVPVPDVELYQGEVENMHDVVLAGGQPLITLAETRDHVRTALALYRAAQEGRVVAMAEMA